MNQDPNNLISWDINFPASAITFTPFLGTEIRITDGQVESRFYRKSTRKDITLHYKSHHPLQTKVQTVKNFYRTAEQASSNPELCEQSFKIVDKLLLANGYEDPRSFQNLKTKQYHQSREDKVLLKLPYISETISTEIQKYINRKNLPIYTVFTPGIKLRDIFCNSRPNDKLQCFRSDCPICSRLENETCTIIAPVYVITCLHCKQQYVGETNRTAFERLSEHLRNASNTTAPSYQRTPLTQHYLQHHRGETPDLHFRIITRECNHLKRKIIEAMYISRLDPQINNKEECKDIGNFLIQ